MLKKVGKYPITRESARASLALVVELFAHTSFLVECFWPDLDSQHVQRAADRLAECAAQSGRDGCPVGYVGSIEITGDDVIFFLFEASSSTEVERVCEQAHLQFERVVGSVVSVRH
jgi:hypothetical protein